MKEGPKFLSRDQIRKRAESWKSGANAYESWSFDYQAGRAEEMSNLKMDSVKTLHGVSFIEEIIPQLIESKDGAEKVRILDIGAGATLFTEEIRKKFGDKVRVFSTGLSKRAVKEYRKDDGGENDFRLHPDDLKWRSILELSDFPEFDLIIDTFGEFSYMIDWRQDNTEEALKKTIQYIIAVIKKLKKGGIASIAPLNKFFSFPQSAAMSKSLEKLRYDLGVEINVVRIGGSNGFDVLKIKKER
jgi:SAM-dependent methyltransferase